MFRSYGIEFRVVFQNRLLEVPEIWGGIDTQLLSERRPGSLGDAQRVGLSTGPVQGEHELSCESFDEGVFSDQGLQLTDHLPMAPQSQVSLDTELDGISSEFLQTGDLRAQRHGIGEIGIRGTSPESEGFAQRRCCVRRIGLEE